MATSAAPRLGNRKVSLAGLSPGKIAIYAIAAWMAVTLVFLLPRLLPGDPIQQLQDQNSGIYVQDPAVRQQLAAYFGLDRPLGAQYLSFLGRVATGDLGRSVAYNQPVTSLVGQRLPWTLLLIATAMTLSALASFFGGLLSAWHRHGLADRTAVALSSVVHAVPPFTTATVLLVAFAVVLPVFPLSGSVTPFAGYTGAAWLGDVTWHLVLPAVALALSMVAGKWLMVRNLAVGAMGSDYMLLARAKGVPESVQRRRHLGANVLPPFLTLLGVEASFVVGGALFVETVFGYPGMGSLILSAVNARDYPLLDGCFLVLTAFVLVANLALDAWYGVVMPGARSA